MADLSDDESVESEPELMTCGELKLHYQNRIEHLLALAPSSHADVALSTRLDLQIGKDIILVLKHAKDTRKSAFEKFSKAIAKHRYAVARKMEDLRENKTAHNANVPGSAIPLVWAFAEIEEAVRTQRDMEKAACKMLALIGVTDSHLTGLNTVCMKIGNSLDIKHSKTYCEKVLNALNPLSDDSLVPEDIVDVTPDPFTGLETVQNNIDQIYALKRANSHTWNVALPDAWKNLWKSSMAYRKAGASEDEVKLLWYITMRRRVLPSTVERLRDLLQPLTEGGKGEKTPVEGKAPQGESGTKTGQKSQDPQSATDRAEKAIKFSRATRVDPPQRRTDEQRKQLLNETYKLLSVPREASRRSVRTKGAFENFLESFYDHLEGQENVESQIDLNVLAAMINGESDAKSKRNKASTGLDNSVLTSDGKSIVSRPMAQSAPIADQYLDLYYAAFEQQQHHHINVEDEIIEMAEKGNRIFNDVWSWNATINDITWLETRIIDKITSDKV